MRKFLNATLCLTLLLLWCAPNASASGASSRALRGAPPQRREAGRSQRIAPPESLTCDRNRLTSFTGAVTSYTRRPGLVRLRMRTDEATSERFTLRFARAEDASKYFLLRGEAFGPGDWRLIEGRRGRLRPRMRATVWVCSDERVPVIDWRPGERPSGVY